MRSEEIYAVGKNGHYFAGRVMVYVCRWIYKLNTLEKMNRKVEEYVEGWRGEG